MAPIVRPFTLKIVRTHFRFFATSMGEDKLVFTMEITSFYTVIPIGEGLLALKHFFSDLRTVEKPSSATLQRLAELVLTLKFFSFANNYQWCGHGYRNGTQLRQSFRRLN